jgi:hypothetical protein
MGVRVSRSILTILTAFVLLVSSFTLSSCKDCGKNDATDNATSDPSDPNNQITEDGYKNASGHALTEAGKHLAGKGATAKEIMEMMKIEKECFGENGYIVFNGHHYWYEDSMGPHEGQSGDANCGLYAIKRLLFVLGRKGIVDKNLWYKYTDDDLREMLPEVLVDKNFRLKDPGVPLDQG